jgi:hypothetical protein
MMVFLCGWSVSFESPLDGYLALTDVPSTQSHDISDGVLGVEHQQIRIGSHLETPLARQAEEPGYIGSGEWQDSFR